MINIDTPRFHGTVTALLLGAAAVPTYAAWETVPEIELRSENDDNVRLSPIDQDSSSRSVADVRFRLSNFGERGNAYIEPRLTTDAYADSRDKDLESDDIFFIARSQYEWQTVAFGFNLDYSDESVLRSEFDNALPEGQDVGDPTDSTAGTVGGYTAQRERSDVRFNLDFDVSERTVVRIASQSVDVSYIEDTAFARARTAYDDTRVSASLIRRVDPRNSVSAAVFVDEYNAEVNSNTTDTYGVEGRFTRPVSQTWTMDLIAGVQRSDFVYLDVLGNTVDNADANFTLGMTLRRQSEVMSWNVAMGRYLNPSSNGYLEVRNEFRVTARREFSERFAGVLGVRATEYEPVVEGTAQPDRSYLSATVELEWALRPRWFVTTGVDYAQEERPQFAALTAESTMIYAAVSYRGRSRQR